VEVRSEADQVSLTVAADLDAVADIVTALIESVGVTVDQEIAATSTAP
jgi:hypothetical protein